MKIIKREILDRIYLLEFASQYELASTFLRFQEHYESPRYRGQVFSLEEYMDWYANQYGNFTYYQDWVGFNIPSVTLEPFRHGLFDPLLEKERRLLKLFSRTRGRFYVIGTARTEGRLSRGTVEHELAHGLFWMNDVYREAVLRGLQGVGQPARLVLEALAAKLRDDGYHDDTIVDEQQALLVTEPYGTPRQRRHLAPLRRRLRALFRHHSRAARWS